MIKVVEDSWDYYLPNKTGWGGVTHDKRSQEIYNFIQQIDYECGDDRFCFKSGGDGDNGEFLLGYLDSYFKYKDEQSSTDDGGMPDELMERFNNLRKEARNKYHNAKTIEEVIEAQKMIDSLEEVFKVYYYSYEMMEALS